MTDHLPSPPPHPPSHPSPPHLPPHPPPSLHKHLPLLFQAQLDEQLAGLQTLTAARRSKLEESIKLHQYLQDVEEVLSWLGEKEDTASSDDYGKDFEHLLVSWGSS